MRILQTIAARDWGGIACRTVEQARWLNGHGHACWLACPPASEVAARAGQAGVPTIPFDFDRPFAPATIARLRRLIGELDCRVIEAHTGRCANAAMFVRDRCVIVRTRHTTQVLKPSMTRYLRWRLAWDWTVATAEVIARNLRDEGLVPGDRLNVIGEWVEERYFRRAEWPAWRQAWRSRLGVAEDAFVVGAVGMLRPEKGFDVLIRAVGLLREHHPDLRAVIVGESAGDPSCARQLRALVAELGLDGAVSFLGYQKDVAGLLQAFDAVAVPSTFEAQSRVIPEALASERPVVASRVGGIGELVRHGDNGWLVWPGDPLSLAAHLERVCCAGTGTAAICRAAGRTAAERLTIGRKMEDYLSVYQAAQSRRRLH